MSRGKSNFNKPDVVLPVGETKHDDVLTDQPPTKDTSVGDPFLDKLFQRFQTLEMTESEIPEQLRSITSLKRKELLGAGGLGTVYEYWDSNLKRSVALKVAKRRVMESPNRLQRFMREREVTARLQHPAIPPVYQTGALEDGRPYYLMRLIAGQSLQVVLSEMPSELREDFRNNSNIQRLFDTFIDVCDAVAYAHTAGIVHRDIKPANIMLQPDGQAFLVDWGLAKTRTREDKPDADSPQLESDMKQESELTEDGQRLGSPDWMSPEQSSGRRQLHGIPTDIYGLGATLYHILAGIAPHATTRPTAKEAVAERVKRISETEPLPVNSVCATVPDELASICQRAMHRDPSQRYLTALELKADLRRWQQRELVQAHLDSYTTFQKMEHFTSRHQKPIVVSLVVLIFAVIGSLWSAFQISQSVNAAETALSAERQANEQLFASMEKYADTIMSEEILAAPELKGLRDKILTDLARQYELWSSRTDGTPDELIRASKGRVRLAEIEQQTGNLQQALLHAERATQLAKQAMSHRQTPVLADLTASFNAQRAQIRLLLETGQLDLAVLKTQELQTEISFAVHPQLTGTQVLEEQAILELQLATLAYYQSGRTTTEEQRRVWVNQALQHATRGVELRTDLRKIDQREVQRTLDLVAAMNTKALMHHKLFESKEAIVIYEQALNLLQMIPKEQISGNAIETLQVKILFNAIMSYRAVEDYDGARKSADQGLAISQTQHLKSPLVIQYRQDIARGYGNLAEVSMVQYLYHHDETVVAELLVDMRHAAEAYLKLYADYPDRTDMQGAAAVHYLRLAACLHWTGRDAEARQEFRRCLSLTEQPELLEPSHQPNAYAVAIGFALLIADENPLNPQEHAFASHFAEVVEKFSPMLNKTSAKTECYAAALANVLRMSM